MTNADSYYTYDFADPNWSRQIMEREYWIMDGTGGQKERLTFFNDPEAPEYLGYPVLVAASDFSPDGRYLVGTLGVDYGSGGKSNVVLMIVLIEFSGP